MRSRRERAVFSAGERYRGVGQRLSIPAVTKGFKSISGLLSELITTMQRHNPCRQIVVVDTFESSVCIGFQGYPDQDTYGWILPNGETAVGVVRDQ